MTVWAKNSKVLETVVIVIAVDVIELDRATPICGDLGPPALFAFRFLQPSSDQAMF